MFYVNDTLKDMIFEELRQSSDRGDGGFLPAVRQVANVAALPGIVKVRNVVFVTQVTHLLMSLVRNHSVCLTSTPVTVLQSETWLHSI